MRAIDFLSSAILSRKADILAGIQTRIDFDTAQIEKGHAPGSITRQALHNSLCAAERAHQAVRNNYESSLMDDFAGLVIACQVAAKAAGKDRAFLQNLDYSAC